MSTHILTERGAGLPQNQNIWSRFVTRPIVSPFFEISIFPNTRHATRNMPFAEDTLKTSPKFLSSSRNAIKYWFVHFCYKNTQLEHIKTLHKRYPLKWKVLISMSERIKISNIEPGNLFANVVMWHLTPRWLQGGKCYVISGGGGRRIFHHWGSHLCYSGLFFFFFFFINPFIDSTVICV